MELQRVRHDRVTGHARGKEDPEVDKMFGQKHGGKRSQGDERGSVRGSRTKGCLLRAPQQMVKHMVNRGKRFPDPESGAGILREPPRPGCTG